MFPRFKWFSVLTKLISHHILSWNNFYRNILSLGRVESPAKILSPAVSSVTTAISEVGLLYYSNLIKFTQKVHHHRKWNYFWFDFNFNSFIDYLWWSDFLVLEDKAVVLLSLLTSIHLHLESKSTAVFDTLLLDADIARQTRIAKMFKRALVSMLETTKIIYCQSYNSPCRNEEIFNWFKKGITRENLNILRVIKKFYFLEVLAFFC